MLRLVDIRVVGAERSVSSPHDLKAIKRVSELAMPVHTSPSEG